MKKILSVCLLAAGMALLLGSGVFFAQGALENRSAANVSAKILAQLPAEALPERVSPAPLPGEEESLVPEHAWGTLSIPALELLLPVMDQCTPELLEQGVCLYEGSNPAEPGLVLAGHSYESMLGSLRQLNPGDVAILRDINGEESRYTMEAWDYIPGDRPEALDAEEWDLTLFTCTYDGSDRYVVRLQRQPSF